MAIDLKMKKERILDKLSVPSKLFTSKENLHLQSPTHKSISYFF